MISLELDDRMATSRPVNRVAGKVVSRGVHYEPRIKLNQHWQAPPSMMPVPKGTGDLTGITFGRLEVIGLSSEFSPLWVVRCRCGNYELRHKYVIQNLENNWDRCRKCKDLLRIQGKKRRNIIYRQHWESCPTMKPVPKNIPNLSWTRVGYLKVVGLHAKGKGKWVVRCVCGDYELRNTRAIRNPGNKTDCCSKCEGRLNGVDENSGRTLDFPPPMKLPPDIAPDLYGVTFGQLTVIGYHRKGQWVVLCNCGNYELRRSKKIKKANPKDCCDECWARSKK